MRKKRIKGTLRETLMAISLMAVKEAARHIRCLTGADEESTVCYQGRWISLHMAKHRYVRNLKRYSLALRGYVEL